jgi:uncharacterized membrane-anchored protein
VVTGLLLVVVLVWPFRADRYRPVRYWAAVALVSVFDTLVTDNLTDSLGVPLESSTVLFGVLLAIAFTVWHRSEGTLSIHSIVTARREAFYWTAILVTFALGTATGDLMAEVLGLGYAPTGLIVVTMIVLTALAWRIGMDAVLSFWIIYVLTRPLGASVGDYLAQPPAQGGLGLGATWTSAIFVVGIVGIVGYLAVSKADVIRGAAARTEQATDGGRHAGRQTAAVVALRMTPPVPPPRSGRWPPPRRWVTRRSSGPSPRTPSRSSTAATSPAPPPGSPTWRSPGTTPTPDSSPVTRQSGPASTARSTPCCANCGPPARNPAARRPPSPTCSAHFADPSRRGVPLTRAAQPPREVAPPLTPVTQPGGSLPRTEPGRAAVTTRGAV